MESILSPPQHLGQMQASGPRPQIQSPRRVKKRIIRNTTLDFLETLGCLRLPIRFLRRSKIPRVPSLKKGFLRWSPRCNGSVPRHVSKKPGCWIWSPGSRVQHPGSIVMAPDPESIYGLPWLTLSQPTTMIVTLLRKTKTAGL